MTIDNWLMIAVILSTLAAPTLANFIQSRTNHPEEAREANQPKNLIQRIGARLMRFFQSLWWSVGWPLVFIPYVIYILSGELRKTAPITRGDVFLISESVAAISFLILNMTVTMMQQSLSSQGESLRTQNEAISTLTGIVGTQLALIKALDETVDLKIKTLALPKPSQADPDKPPPGTLRKMLTAVRSLFTKLN